MHWFNQIRKHGPGIGLDKRLDRHARDELRAVELTTSLSEIRMRMV